MVTLTWPPFVALFACSWIVVLCQETQEVKAGEDATLQCQGHREAAITLIKWSKPDLKSDDGYVFFFSLDEKNENIQHPSYRGRVELRDPEMKDGDTSVILKNVKTNDTGTYECRVREKDSSGKVEVVSSIGLTVTEPGHTAGHKEGGDKEGNVGLKVGLLVGVILLVGVSVVVFRKKIFGICRVCKDNNSDKHIAHRNVPMRTFFSGC
ncbi:coxsackievirus and adenovirus receptor homolog [Micropterus salmoides]|uniref:coxsackievirus and adenovirus receptor homolog n=1 Tax=Micropterus salmoides TaxID=27706 RepID=UPI0018ED3317|nr:coxsackievirus and adenovirus receptor homolog [Micropterus salmoides]